MKHSKIFTKINKKVCPPSRWLCWHSVSMTRGHTIFELSDRISLQKRKSLWNRFCLFILGQGWEFPHPFSEWIGIFLQKNERFTQKNEQFAHFWWVTWANCSQLLLFWWLTWAICSQSLFCHEWPERFAHSRSFFMSNLSNLLTVAHLSWAIWANERWANEQIPNPVWGPHRKFEKKKWSKILWHCPFK